MCREIKETEIEMPESLHDRIVAATVGAQEPGNWRQRLSASLRRFLSSRMQPLWTPQMAVAALIFAASSLLILSRFGSVRGMATQAGIQAESLVTQGQRALTNTGAMARTGFQRVSFLFDDGAAKQEPTPAPNNTALPRKSDTNPASGKNGKKEPSAEQREDDSRRNGQRGLNNK